MEAKRNAVGAWSEPGGPCFGTPVDGNCAVRQGKAKGGYGPPGYILKH